MKIVLMILGLTLNTTVHAESKTVAVSITAQVEVQKVKAACVQYVNSEGESNGYQLFYAYESSTQVIAVKKAGLSAAYILDGESCSEPNRGNLTLITVPEYSKSTFVNTRILDGGGYKDLRVVFYDSDKLAKDLTDAKSASFEAL